MAVAARKKKVAHQGNAKKEVLKAAYELIKTKGFNGFSFKDISEIVGIRTSSIHYYFPTKNDLAKAILELHRAYVFEQLGAIAASGEDTKGRLRTYADLYYEMSVDGAYMCPVAMLSAERDSLSETTVEQLTGYFDDQRMWLTEQFEVGKNDGDIRVIGRSVNAASMYLATVEGAVVLARASKSSHDFKNIVNQMLNQLI